MSAANTFYRLKFILCSISMASCCFIPVTQSCAQTNICGWLQPKVANNINATPTHNNAAFAAYMNSSQNVGADSVYSLPVVVHVIHTGTPVGAADNPDDSHILQMINGLNKAWRKNGAAYGGADMKIQFKLAVRSPACVASSGINRVDGSGIPNYASGGITNYNNPNSAPETTVKSLSRWPNTDYINIWIVNKINGNSFAPGGYAYFPEYNSALTDGIVLNASVVDSSNKTIVHEMGHVFFLYHTFADGGYDTTCAANTDCSTQGDLICDTEPHLFETACSTTNNSCSGNPYSVADTAHSYTVLNNYMGYTSCQWMFTENQKARVRAALFAFRPGLINSAALSVAPAVSPSAPCLPSATNGLSPYYGVQQVEFNSINVYSNNSKADGSSYIDRTCNQSTTVVKGNTYTLTVTGSYLNPHRIKAFIDYNNDGVFNDSTETVLSDYQGQASTAVTIPLTGVLTNKPLRLRIVADNPTLPEPTACLLHGSINEGAGQTEDYSIMLLKRQIFSVASGAWDSPATWSCNCVPQTDDYITIKAPNTINITAAMGALQCGGLLLEKGATFNMNGNLMVLQK